MSVNLDTSIKLITDRSEQFNINKLLENFNKNRILRQKQKLERSINNYWLLYSADSEFRKELAKILNITELKIDFNTFNCKVLKNLNSIEKIFLEKKQKFLTV